MPEPTFPPEGNHDRTFSCRHVRCPSRGPRGTSHIAHRSWTGKDKPIERLRCTACGPAFSERRGPLMEATKLPAETVERLRKCQRWGVCDAGTADICGVDSKTVQRFQTVAAQRAQTHHEQGTRELQVAAVHLDEMHSKRRGSHVAWRHTAIAMSRRFVLGGHWGPRTQESVALLRAQVVARRCGVPVWLSAGGKAYPAALLQVLGQGYRRRRRGRRGRPPKPRLGPPRKRFDGQVVKVRDGTGQLLRVGTRVVSGGPRRFVQEMAGRGLRPSIQVDTARVWWVVALDNFVLPHIACRPVVSSA